jgi:diphosphomevalonate decarboxylase
MQHVFNNSIPKNLQLLQEKIVNLKLQGKIVIQNGDDGYASAPSNIALLKYWGKEPEQNQIPVNSSLSYTLGGFRSFTKVTAVGHFLPIHTKAKAYFKNSLTLNNKIEENLITEKIDHFLKAILFPYGTEIALDVKSFNNFPTACGIASSASGYAALVAAIADLLQLQIHFSEQELLMWLTEWARLGSGSATRSAVPNSDALFVAWNKTHHKNLTATTTTAIPFHENWKELQHCVFILDDKAKTISSSNGHRYASTSPLQAVRVAGIPFKLKLIEKALIDFDFNSVAYLTEDDALAMHAVMQTGTPPACYLTHEVGMVIAEFIKLRNNTQSQAFWTLDAGSNIHILFLPSAIPMLKEFHHLLNTNLNKNIPILVNASHNGLSIGKEAFDSLSNLKTLKGNLG